MDTNQPPGSPPEGGSPAAEGGPSDAVIETLRSVSLFEGLEDGDLERIRDIAEPFELPAGEVLFEEGDKGETFFVIVGGSIELSKASPKGSQKLAVLRAGQAFGEMALLNQAPRSATATAIDDTSMLTISHDAFERLLGGDALPLRVMKGLSRALWATSVRLTAKQSLGSEARAAVGELNRVVRGQLSAKEPPRVPGYDVSARASFHRQSRGAAAWDAFVLQDGRQVVALLRAEGSGMLHAQNLAITRALLREVAARPHADLAAYLNGVHGALRRVAVPGLSQPTSVTLIALSGEGVEWATAGNALGVLCSADGTVTRLDDGAPALGEDVEHDYRSQRATMAAGDALVALAEGPANAVDDAAEVLADGVGSQAKALAARVVERITREDAGLEGVFDTIAVVVAWAGAGAGAGDAPAAAAPEPEPAEAVPAEPEVASEPEAVEAEPAEAMPAEPEVASEPEAVEAEPAPEPEVEPEPQAAVEPEPEAGVAPEATAEPAVRASFVARPDPAPSAPAEAPPSEPEPAAAPEMEVDAAPTASGADASPDDVPEDPDPLPLLDMDSGPEESEPDAAQAEEEEESGFQVIEEGFTLEVEDPEDDRNEG